MFRKFLLGGFHVKFSKKAYLCRRFFYRQCFFYRHRGDYHPLPLDGRAEERLALLEEARSARLAAEEQLVVLPRGPWHCFGLCHGAVINQLTQWYNNISILDTGMNNHPLFYPKSDPPFLDLTCVLFCWDEESGQVPWDFAFILPKTKLNVLKDFVKVFFFECAVFRAVVSGAWGGHL